MSLQEPQEVQDLVPGVHLGHYILMEKLAEGGMGIVFKAFEPALGRSVAIKVLLPEYAKNETYIRHFQEEAQVVASLQHPNIVPIYFIGRLNQIAYFSMAYIQGQTLDDWIVHGRRMNLPEARWFMAQAVSALDHASQVNLIHLDIKPSNFLIDSKPMVMLADFGLAQNLTDDSEPEEREVFGTPYYVAPEQIQKLSTDLRTDIYSLGATLFHLTVGHAPFEGESVDEIVEAHLSSPYPFGAAIAAGVNLGLVNLIKKMMERDPINRFQNYRELTQALENIETFRYQSPQALEIETTPQTPVQLPSGRREMLYGILLETNAEWARAGGTVDIRFSRNQIIGALQNEVRPLSLNALSGTMKEICSSSSGDLQDLTEAAQKFPGYRKMVHSLALFLSPETEKVDPESHETFKLIGLNRARNLALLDFMLTYEWKTSVYFDWKPLWQHQVACAIMIDYIYEALDLKRSGTEFATGLFHDLGKVILGELYPLAYFNIMQSSLRDQVPLHQCEEGLFGLNHGEIASLWMRNMDLPSSLAEAVAEHESTVSPPKKMLLRHALLSVNHLCRQLALGYSGNGVIPTAEWDALPSTRILWEARRRMTYTWDEFRTEFPTHFRTFPNLFPSAKS